VWSPLAAMPIHLPPLSRREFVRRTLVVGAGLLFAPAVLAASRELDDNCWALLSDPHIAADRTKIARGVSMASQFHAAVADVLQQSRRPAGALINGDLPSTPERRPTMPR